MFDVAVSHLLLALQFRFNLASISIVAAFVSVSTITIAASRDKRCSMHVVLGGGRRLSGGTTGA